MMMMNDESKIPIGFSFCYPTLIPLLFFFFFEKISEKNKSVDISLDRPFVFKQNILFHFSLKTRPEPLKILFFNVHILNKIYHQQENKH